MKEIFLGTDDLLFERGHPSDFRHRFADDIQPLRYDYYRAVFGQRSSEQVRRFVSRLTLESWNEPNTSVGTTARTGQRRIDPQVVLATDLRTDAIRGFWYAAANVSSKAERVLNRLHVPTPITAPIGKWERQQKLERGRYYVWSSECVHDPKRPELPSVLGGLCLETFDQDLVGTWYPWDEETELKRQLTKWGYVWDDDKPYPIDGSKNFGAGASNTNQERWVVSSIGEAVDAMGRGAWSK